jgi:hypothetical protein
MHKDSNLRGLLSILKLLKYRLDNMEPLRRLARDDLVLDPKSATRGFHLRESSQIMGSDQDPYLGRI